MFGKRIKKILICLTAVAVCVTSNISSGIISLSAGESKTLVSVDFEDGKLGGWRNRGDASVTVVPNPTNRSKKSLKITGKTAGWQGAEYDISGLVEAGIEYKYSIDVYHEAATPQEIKLTNQIKKLDGEDDWNQIIEPQIVPANEWVTLEGTYVIAPDSIPAVFYPDTVNETFDFYIDNFIIENKNGASTLPDTNWEGIEEDFEQGTLNGWVPRIGTEIVEIVDGVAHGGTKSLKVSNRNIDYEGIKYPFIDEATNSAVYNIKTWVYQASGSDQEINLKIEKHIDGSASYDSVAGWDVPSGEWTQLTGQYSLFYAGELTDISIYLESPNETLEFYIDDFSMQSEVTKVPDIDWDLPSVYKAYEDDFTVGVALPADSLSNSDKSSWTLHHFNTLTAENDMKPESYMDQKASEATGELTLNFTKSDQYYNYAKENGIPLRGHTLIWHSQTPGWFFNEGFKEDGDVVDRETMLKRMDNHIEQVTMRYINKDIEAGLTKPTIYAWDVVNEAIEINDGKANGMRNSLWTQTIGDDFVEKAFEYTRKHTEGKYTGGKVELFYNDYNTESADRRTAMFNMITPIAEKGWIDGVGLQSHVNLMNPTAQNIERTIQMVGELGLEAHITELDISAYLNDGDSYEKFPEDLAIKQAYRYKSLFDMFKANKEILTNVTFWGLTDDASWLNTFPVTRGNWPLLFDKNLQPKPAYWALVDDSKLPLMIQDTNSHKGKVVIDGNEDFIWTTQVATPISQTDSTVSFKTLWEKDMLYLWVEVIDQDVNADDSIIIYADEKVTILRSGKVDSENVLANVQKTSKGYTVEAAIPLQNSVAEGDEILFDLAIVDDQVITRWNDPSQTTNAVPERYGKLILKDAIKTTKAMKGTPTIDGGIDSIWVQANEITTDIYTQNTQGAKANVKTLWDQNYLYILVEVADSNLNDANANAWEQDSVEVFIDENFNRTDYYQSDDVQYRINFKNFVTINGGPEDLSLKSVVKIVEGGYRIEMAIPFILKPFQDGQIMGFDVQVNDDHGSGERDSMMNWNDVTGRGYENTESYGVIILEKQKGAK